MVVCARARSRAQAAEEAGGSWGTRHDNAAAAVSARNRNSISEQNLPTPHTHTRTPNPLQEIGSHHIYDGSGVQAMNAAGYSVCGIDLEGSGRSDGLFGASRAASLRFDRIEGWSIDDE